MQALEKTTNKIVQKTNIETLISQENEKSENEKYQDFEIKKYLENTNFSTTTQNQILETIEKKWFCPVQAFSSQNIIQSFWDYFSNQFLYIFVVLWYFAIPAYFIYLIEKNIWVLNFLYFCIALIFFFILNILFFYKQQVIKNFFKIYNAWNSVFMKNSIYNQNKIIIDDIKPFLDYQQKLLSIPIKDLFSGKNLNSKRNDINFTKIDWKVSKFSKSFEVKSKNWTWLVMIGLSTALVIFSNFLYWNNQVLYHNFFGIYFILTIFSLIFLPIFKNIFNIFSKKIGKILEKKIKNFVFYDQSDTLDYYYNIFEKISYDLEKIEKFSKISQNIKSDFLQSIWKLDEYNQSLSQALIIFENISKNLKLLKNNISSESKQKIFSIARENISNVLRSRQLILQTVETDINSVLAEWKNISDKNVQLRMLECENLKKWILQVKEKFEAFDQLI